MKWTNHSRLESLYHTRVVGWPPDVPMLNPSGMSVGQMKTLLGALRDGNMRFERVGGGEVVNEEMGRRGTGGEVVVGDGDGGDVDEEDISWAIQEAGPSTPTVCIKITQ